MYLPQAHRELRAAEALKRQAATTASQRAPSSLRTHWLRDDVNHASEVISPRRAPSPVPAAFANTAPPDALTALRELLRRTDALQEAFAGMTVAEASAVHQVDPTVIALRDAWAQWGEAHVARRLTRRHPKDDGDPLATYGRLHEEIAATWDALSFEPGCGRSVVLGASADLLAWQLYTATWASEVSFIEDGEQHLIHFRRHRPSIELAYMRAQIQIYAWSDVVDKPITWLAQRVPPAEGSTERAIARIALLVEDLLEMKPRLFRGYRPERHLAALPGGGFATIQWALGDQIAFIAFGDTEEQIIEQSSTLRYRYAAALLPNGRLGYAFLPWRRWDQPQLEAAALELVHARLFEDWERASTGTRAPTPPTSSEDADDEDTRLVAEACVRAAQADAADEAPDEAEVAAGRRYAVPSIRMASLLRLLTTVGCEVEQGKGSEVTVFRPGGKKFALGHHHRNRHVPAHLVRLLLRRVGVGVEEWLGAIG